MKKLVILSLMLISLFELSAQYNTTFVGSTKSTVTLRSIGYGKKAEIAIADAELNAIRTVLFMGVENTPFRIPLIQGGKEMIEQKHSEFFDMFYGGEYRSFVETSVKVTPFGKNEVKQKCITLDVTIRVSSLRTYLENNNIIRKFGL